MIERNSAGRMMVVRLVSLFALFFAAFVAMSSASSMMQAEEAYRNDFERPDKLRKHWSTAHRDITPKGERTCLGRFGSEAVTLTVDELPEHKYVRISFELFIVGNWGGTSKDNAPDLWQLSVDDGPVLVNASFSLWDRVEYPQSFPANYPLARVTANTGAAETNTLGYIYSPQYGVSDAVYKLSYVVPHQADAIVFNFSALGQRLVRFPEGNLLATWALDNVVVETLDQRAAVKLDEEKLRQAWKNLESEDAVKAHLAIWQLIGAQDQTVTFMGKHLGDTLTGPDLAKLIKQLDSKDFEAREAATKKLTELVPFTDQETLRLTKAMKETQSAEVQDRLNEILKANTSAPAKMRPAERRQRRVKYILELIGTDSANRLRKKHVKNKS